MQHVTVAAPLSAAEAFRVSLSALRPRSIATSARRVAAVAALAAGVMFVPPAAQAQPAPRIARPTVPTRPARGPEVAASTGPALDDRDSSAGASTGEIALPAAERRPARTAHYRSARDSVAGVLAERTVARTRGLRVGVSLEDRMLHVLDGDDTLLVAPIAIGTDQTVTYGTKSWTFQTPRGHRTVIGKQENPVWTPPEWHYAEVANNLGLKLAHLPEKGTVPIGQGRRLAVRGGKAGVIGTDGVFEELPVDEEIVFNNTLYIPPGNTENRKIDGELGRFKLMLGDGYYLHGTPHEDTIGDAATHGCIRLYDEDIEWLYQHVPVGTPVFIY